MKLPLTMSTTIFFLIILISAPFFQVQTKQDGFNRILSNNFQFSPDQSEITYLIATGDSGGNQTLRLLDSNFNIISSFTGHSGIIRGIDIDSDGNIYSGSSDNTVRKISPQGNQIWSFSFPNDVRALGIDSDSNVYASSRDNTVRKISSTGSQIWSFSHNDRLEALHVTLDGIVYVGSRNTIITKLDTNGNSIWTNSNHTGQIRGLHVNNNNELISTGTDNTLRKFNTSNGNQIWTTNLDSIPNEIITDINNNIYITLTNGTIQKFNNNGQFQWSITLPNNPIPSYSLSIDFQNNLLVGDRDGNLHKIDSNGNILLTENISSDSVFVVASYTSLEILTVEQNYYQIFENARTAEYSNVDGFMSLIYTLPTTANRLYNSWLKFTTPTEWIPDSINPSRIKDDDGNYRDITFTEIEDNWFFNLWGQIVRFIDGTN